MTHTYTELEVSPGTYLEVREGLINAGYPQDGTTLDLRGVGLTKGVLETRLIKALAAGMRIEDGKILPDVGVEGEAAASATYTDIEVAAILSAGEHWAFRTLVVALGMIAMQPAAVQASILPIIEKNLVEILRGSAAGIKSFGAHVVSRVVDRESKRQERQAAGLRLCPRPRPHVLLVVLHPERSPTGVNERHVATRNGHALPLECLLEIIAGDLVATLQPRGPFVPCDVDEDATSDNRTDLFNAKLRQPLRRGEFVPRQTVVERISNPDVPQAVELCPNLANLSADKCLVGNRLVGSERSHRIRNPQAVMAVAKQRDPGFVRATQLIDLPRPHEVSRLEHLGRSEHIGGPSAVVSSVLGRIPVGLLTHGHPGRKQR